MYLLWVYKRGPLMCTRTHKPPSLSPRKTVLDCWFCFLVILTNKHCRMARFEKKLTKTNEGSMFVIPTRFSRNHMRRVQGGRSENITVVDVGGTVWTFGYYVRRHRNPRPVLRSGWRRYIIEKELKVGDRIIFERVDGFLELYRIGARRRITLFGQEVWTDVF